MEKRIVTQAEIDYYRLYGMEQPLKLSEADVSGLDLSGFVLACPSSKKEKVVNKKVTWLSVLMFSLSVCLLIVAIIFNNRRPDKKTEMETVTETGVETEVETETVMETVTETGVETEVETETETESETKSETVTEATTETIVVTEYYDIPLTEAEQDIVNSIADKYGVDNKLLYSIAYIESRYQTDSVSSSGALGMYQIMPQWYGYDIDYSDICQSTERCCQILVGHWVNLKDWTKVLNKYNTGDPNNYNGYSDNVWAYYNTL